MSTPLDSLADLRAEIEATKERNRLAVVRFIEARQRFRALRDGATDLPVFPVGPLADEGAPVTTTHRLPAPGPKYSNAIPTPFP